MTDKEQDLDELNQAPTEEGGEEAENPGEEETELDDAQEAEAETNQDEQDLDDSQSVNSEGAHPDDPRGVKKRIDKVVGQKKEAEEKARALAVQLQKAQQELERYRAARQESEPEPVEPVEDDFGDDWKGYQKAHKAYWTKRLERDEEEKKVVAALRAQAEIDASFEVQSQAAKEKYQDFDSVVQADNAPVSPLMAHFIKKSPLSAEVVYHLLKNERAFAERLYNETDADKVAMAIGKVEGRLEKSPVKVKSNASKPTQTLTGGGGSGGGGMDKLMKASETNHDEDDSFSSIYWKMVGEGR